MKKVLIMLVGLMTSLVMMGQNEVVGPPITINIVKEVPHYDLNIGAMEVNDYNGNRVLDANETCELTWEVKNEDSKAASGLVAKLSNYNNAPGVAIATTQKTLPKLNPGASVKVTFEISSNKNTAEGVLKLLLSIEGANRQPMADKLDGIATLKFEPAMVRITDYVITDQYGTTIPNGASLTKGESYGLSLSISNEGNGAAEGVRVQPDAIKGVSVYGGICIANERIEAHQTITRKGTLKVMNSYRGENLALTFSVTENQGGAENKTINVRVTDGDVTVWQPETVNHATANNPNTHNYRDVDSDIPETGIKNSRLHVLIIANQEYQDEANVMTARNDATQVANYCRKVLGAKDVRYDQRSFSKSALAKALTNFCSTMKAMPEDQYMVFYFGHGIPNPMNPEDAYLLGTDGIGYSRQEMINAIAEANPSRCIVYLESCFSGKRGDDGSQLKATSGQSSSAFRVQDAQAKGNILIVSASSGDQPAYWTPDNSHNFFTYNFLKALKEAFTDNHAKGITWGEVLDNARIETIIGVPNAKGSTYSQTPYFQFYNNGTEWKSWPIK